MPSLHRRWLPLKGGLEYLNGGHQLHLFEWPWGSNLLTYSWIPLKKEPKSPIMPRNSTRLRFRTIYSSQTFEIPYSVAPPSTKRSPISLFSPRNKQGKKSECLKTGIFCLEPLHVPPYILQPSVMEEPISGLISWMQMFCHFNNVHSISQQNLAEVKGEHYPCCR